ncbi:6,7-dimethyl-8-ribityllumazine synthase [Arthrobacter sp. UM1]|uniref:6,7-dimethyl-8-ribityllumazine synthase n=1 Tax=Arthrobacter sp. UM1 TaxID=2766776 RepID=UPI001CF6CB91|nr:6,7-dimethyl-8-ribityllumazine synthase [Arthrobacter sp. UM1]MCB4207627.1 6,7-dimethyl-8-ribityllumazine synthase [Arthrobacter sp. UM1]
MASHGAPAADLTELSEDALGVKVAILAGTWHAQVMDGLIAGARRGAEDAGLSADLYRAPGAFELPVLASALLRRYDAVVALGVVIRGGTPHFEYVCNAATDGLTRVALDAGKPVGFGVLTVDNEQQALDRAGLEDSREDKGYEAMAAALETAVALKKLA